MARPSKSVDVLKAEKKSHRTKAELEQRDKAGKELLSGIVLKERKEVKENEIAHKEFLRVKKILEAVKKNDAIIEPVINRYCMLQGECADFEAKRELFTENLKELMDSDIEPEKMYKLQTDMQKSILALDKQVQAKRRMLFDIEKENGMTLASAMRSIPKTVDTEESPLLKALRGDG